MARKADARAADLEAWARYLRHVTPLPGMRAPAVADPAAPMPMVMAATVATLPSPQPRLRRPATAIAIGVAPPGLDRATWTRFRAGRIAPDRTLDLHGMTLAPAHGAVIALVAGAAAQGLRCVEIVTGHGRRAGGEGVLRREVPFWLSEAPLRPLILAICHPHPANPGALRVLLRRAR
ncbi:MAG: Smr/MutS family protein [Acidiphilium sp.]